MPDEIQQPPTPEVETTSGPKDLRSELEADLKSEFAVNLSAEGTLPKDVCGSLVALLGSNSPTSAEVLQSLSLEDPAQPEVPHE
jgi:hypothetical protein